MSDEDEICCFVYASFLVDLFDRRPQTGFFHTWGDRVHATSGQQPAWAVPVVGSSSTIVQLARGLFASIHLDPYGDVELANGKGVNPFGRTGFDINLLPRIQPNTPKSMDGAGDFSVIGKYRPFAGNETGNYSTLVQVAFSVPTGSYKNGTAVSTITPTVVGLVLTGRIVSLGCYAPCEVSLCLA